jgi:hypothetical protein
MARSRTNTRQRDLFAVYIRRLPVALVLVMLMWLAIRPVLDPAVCHLSQLLIRAFEYPRVTRIEVEDHRAKIIRSDFRTGSNIPTVSLTEVHFNTIVLLSLYFALPDAFRRKRLERLVMAWFVLYITQSLNLMFHVKTIYALYLGEWSAVHYADWQRNLWGFLRYFTDLPGRFGFPFVLWMVFDWPTFSKLLRTDTEDPEATQKKRKR